MDLSKYTINTYLRIVTYKTAFYTFYLPAAAAMHLCGIASTASLKVAKDICIQLGQFFQIQDDYLDCYGAPEVIGKIGTDIEDSKCSWLAVQALDRANDKQKAVFKANYGKKDPAAVKKVKAVYAELKLEARPRSRVASRRHIGTGPSRSRACAPAAAQEQYKKYEEDSYVKLKQAIEKQKLLPQALFGEMLAKIYKRRAPPRRRPATNLLLTVLPFASLSTPAAPQAEVEAGKGLMPPDTWAHRAVLVCHFAANPRVLSKRSHARWSPSSRLARQLPTEGLNEAPTPFVGSTPRDVRVGVALTGGGSGAVVPSSARQQRGLRYLSTLWLVPASGRCWATPLCSS